MTSSGIVLIGQTGSGKSTQAKLLADHFHCPLISSGDIAREIAEADSFTESALTQGSYAPEVAIRREVVMRVESAIIQSGIFVLEGFPRKVEQLIVLEQLARRRDIEIVYVHLDVPDLTCIRRLVGRGRRGDNPDSISAKLAAWRTDTLPVLDILRHQRRGFVTVFGGADGRSDIHRAIKDGLCGIE
jgi:adenylate kinase